MKYKKVEMIKDLPLLADTPMVKREVISYFIVILIFIDNLHDFSGLVSAETAVVLCDIRL